MNFRFTQLSLITLVLALYGCQANPVRPVPPSAFATKIVQGARAQIGRPYHYGGESPRAGFDCSGLVFYSLARTGHRVPRTTGGQYRASTPIARKNLRPGDLVFFRFRRSRAVSHVGIYLGKGRFIHAPATDRHVTIANLNSPFWTRHFVRGGRFRR